MLNDAQAVNPEDVAAEVFASTWIDLRVKRGEMSGKSASVKRGSSGGGSTSCHYLHQKGKKVEGELQNS